MKKQLIATIAEKLHNFGFLVYLSKSKEHGFYTDGNRVISFGGHWNFFLDFSGNYQPSSTSGTGWMIATEQHDITKEQARAYINRSAPTWANRNPVYTTPEQHLKTYGKSSGYELFSPATIGA